MVGLPRGSLMDLTTPLYRNGDLAQQGVPHSSREADPELGAESLVLSLGSGAILPGAAVKSYQLGSYDRFVISPL